MDIVEKPTVYLLGKTELDTYGLRQYLHDIGDPGWKIPPNPNAEQLIEAAGRMCYRSWQPYDPEKPLCSNPNVTKTREGNKEYLDNILKVGHGSILEHVSMSFIIRDCSRVLTHELVRHRLCAFSQESLRYVRLENLRFWFPDELLESPEGKKFAMDKLLELENIQKEFQEIFKIKDIKDFSIKKKLTSMFRRLAPIGLATSIMFSSNLRNLRHMIAMRTSVSAEQEIRIVFLEVAKICMSEFPNVFQDMEISNDGTCTFKYGRV